MGDPVVDGLVISILIFFVCCACSIVWQIRVCRRRNGREATEEREFQRRIEDSVHQHHQQQQIIQQQKLQQKQNEQPVKPRHQLTQTARNKIIGAVTAAAGAVGIRTNNTASYRRPGESFSSGGVPSSPSAKSSSYSIHTAEHLELVTHSLDDGEFDEQINLEEAEAQADAQFQAEVEAEIEAHGEGTSKPVYSLDGRKRGGYQSALFASPKHAEDEQEDMEVVRPSP